MLKIWAYLFFLQALVVGVFSEQKEYIVDDHIFLTGVNQTRDFGFVELCYRTDDFLHIFLKYTHSRISAHRS